jgi:nickel transport system ATP-binding protein
LLDEAVSSLDVSIQVQILDLFLQLSEEYHINYLLITHDIQIACYLCKHLVIFHDGTVVEQIDREHVSALKCAYSRELLESIITI